MFDYSWFSCAMLMECGSELRGGTVLGLKHCQVYKRKAKRTYYGWQDAGLSLPLSRSNMQSDTVIVRLCSHTKSFCSETALSKCGCNFLFRAEPLFRVGGCFFGTVSSTAQLSLTPDRFPPNSTQTYSTIINSLAARVVLVPKQRQRRTRQLSD